MAYGEQCPTDSATKKFEGVLADNGAAANEFVAKAGVNYRAQNAENVADQVVQLTTTGGAGATLGTTADAAVVTDAAGTLSGKLRGLVKWAFERMPAALGQTTKANSFPVVFPSDQTLTTSPNTFDNITFELTGDVFDAGDVIEGLQTIALAGSVRLKNIVLSETAAVALKANLDILIFSANPSLSVFTNNAAPNIDTGDILKICGCIKIATADYETFGTPTGLAVVNKMIDIPVLLGTNIYIVVVTRDAVSYASSPCLRVRIDYEI